MKYLRALHELWIVTTWTGDETIIDVVLGAQSPVTYPPSELIHLDEGEPLGFEHIEQDGDPFQVLMETYPGCFVIENWAERGIH